MEGDAQKGGSDMSAHLATLYTLARTIEHGEIVELGVGGGWSSIAFLLAAHENGKSVTSYDFWDGCRELSNKSFKSVGLLPDDPRLAKWKLCIKKSTDGAQDFPDQSVGLLFIDSAHSYEITKQELNIWLPKMHPRGIICGHDYLLERFNAEIVFGVKPAVDEFLEQNKNRFRFQLQPYSWGLFILWPK